MRNSQRYTILQNSWDEKLATFLLGMSKNPEIKSCSFVFMSSVSSNWCNIQLQRVLDMGLTGGLLTWSQTVLNEKKKKKQQQWEH